MHIRLAVDADLQPLSHLFDHYRQSCDHPSDINGCYTFLSQRLSENDSIIFVAFESEIILGFIQLYPSFSSLMLQPVWYFEDAFVLPKYRNQGIASQMIARAGVLAKSAQVKLIDGHREQSLRV
ncbi:MULTISPECIES: GNAT family N-acetyltransferase [Shewanella]|jgi:GNAT superfamily N-acetyltransferase|uniref:GNAT family N-acetyltransferase n=1 Tax=Shewanella holmiensis TaxID=2952222 RepID=A0A9X2WJA5_9GAMM|nr:MULTISPECIES: GNAT family N-acetyltransferase [Shewanella]MCT7940283.1 GNAT family N-acetyltransferase [Shewanella holmiensis]MDP5147085.1 GNAT family N-acetyltransferase [Shewanella sp. ULN5]